MAYRSATYIAFDGQGETNPSQSDFRYYATIQGWHASSRVEFKFANSHERTSAVRDTSSRETLKARIRERLAQSKNCVVILSDQTRKSGSMLSYEIERSVDSYSLPLICAYTGVEALFNPTLLSNRWPDVLTARIQNQTATAIHIPFKMAALYDAIGQFSVHSSSLVGALNFYSRDAHAQFGLI
jgi:hypothetical protein